MWDLDASQLFRRRLRWRVNNATQNTRTEQTGVNQLQASFTGLQSLTAHTLFLSREGSLHLDFYRFS